MRGAGGVGYRRGPLPAAVLCEVQSCGVWCQRAVKSDELPHMVVNSVVSGVKNDRVDYQVGSGDAVVIGSAVGQEVCRRN